MQLLRIRAAAQIHSRQQVWNAHAQASYGPNAGFLGERSPRAHWRNSSPSALQDASTHENCLAVSQALSLFIFLLFERLHRRTSSIVLCTTEPEAGEARSTSLKWSRDMQVAKSAPLGSHELLWEVAWRLIVCVYAAIYNTNLYRHQNLIVLDVACFFCNSFNRWCIFSHKHTI